MTETDWSPEDEVDPTEIAKQQLALGKKFMERVEKEDREREDREREERKKRELDAPPCPEYRVPPSPPPPTFEEVSAMIKKVWDEVKTIVPDAPDHVKVQAFEHLLSVIGRRHYGVVGTIA